MFGFLRRKENFERPPAPAAVTLEAVAYVRNDVARPRPRGWEGIESTIEFLPEHELRLHGLDRYSHVIVVFATDLAAAAPEKPEQMTLASGHVYGVFATRSQLRPNHLGVSAIQLLGVDGCSVRVRGLDAIDGTPVLDIKPYLPEYDTHPGATVPEGTS